MTKDASESEASRSFDAEYAAARFAKLSTDELRAVIGRDRGDYEEQAIELARRELSGRGLDPYDVAPPASAPESDRPRPQGVAWLDVYTALAAMQAVARPVTHLVVLGSAWSEVLTIDLPLSLLQGAVAYGLRERRAWGWYLNWPCLFLVIFASTAGQSAFAGLAGLVALVLHGIYFAKRRSLFIPAVAPAAVEAPKRKKRKKRPGGPNPA